MSIQKREVIEMAEKQEPQAEDKRYRAPRSYRSAKPYTPRQEREPEPEREQ